MTLTATQFDEAIAANKLEKLVIQAMGWQDIGYGSHKCLVNKTLPGALAMVELLDGYVTFSVFTRIPLVTLKEHIQIEVSPSTLFEYMMWYWVANWRNYNVTCLKNSYYNVFIDDVQANWFKRLEFLFRLYECERLASMKAWSVPDKDYILVTPTPGQT